MKKLLSGAFGAVLMFWSSTASALDTEEILATVAMPLAVAAVADLTDIDTEDLLTLVYALNDANVAPTKFVEIIRYVPVVLLDPEAAPDFIAFVETESRRSSDGDALATVLGNRLVESGATTIRVEAPEPIRSRAILPPVVVDRAHPHGGPPGQVKKQIGVQTGAEVVHGEHPSNRARPVNAEDKPVPPGKARDQNAGRDRDDGNPGKERANKARDHNPGKGKAKGKKKDGNR
ncbi:MAG: hypothetical protein KY459_10930 [Acidobacteria bacterium]|nr:hypothetical protein [Acidobacteriota bacterium]